MKRRRFLLIITLSIIIITFIPKYFIDTDKVGDMKFYESHDVYEKIYKNVTDLERDAELIVEVRATGEKNNQVILEGNIPLYYWTESKFEVVKVYKDNYSIQENDVITVNEPYALINKNEVFISEGYEMTMDGGSYLLFLAKKENEETFLPVAVYHGKYDMNNNAMNPFSNRMKKFELDHPDYVELKNTVDEKYKLAR